ncbi:unnamed protein product [Cuscuta campestris]|uniref:rRNA N-glycosylase n=1 Tax=Cuscuta campestris TaxID=132261 RepID=A0A484MMZ8_9ASTE|nr:unnamed protein product [Cuscuta campestris]
MEDLPLLDLSIVEKDPYQWKQVYCTWIHEARVQFNSPIHQRKFVGSDGVTKSFLVLPPIPENQIPTFKIVRVVTSKSSIALGINSHNLRICAFQVEGHWYVFKDAPVGGLSPYTYTNVIGNYMELTPLSRQHPYGDAPTLKDVHLCREAIITAVNVIASPWQVDEHGIAIIDARKAKASIILFQMISESIRFHSVSEIMSGLVFVASDPFRHNKIWKYQNRWWHVSDDIHELFDTEEQPLSEEVVDTLSKYGETFCVIMSAMEPHAGYIKSG